MNVMRENLSQRTRQWKTKIRNKNAPIFNTFRKGTLPPNGHQPQRFISSSESSLANITTVNVERGTLLATAERTSSSSNLTVPATNNVFATPHSALRRQEPRITEPFLAESFQTPRQNKSTTDTSTAKVTASASKRNLQCLPPPNSFSGGKKSRSTSSSGPHPLTTPSTSRTPRTPRSGFSFDSAEHYVIVAITEGRGIARGEVGLAAIDMRNPYLILCQIGDSQTYINTLMKINILNANEVLVPNTFVDGQTPTKLFTLINESFPSVTITTVQRRHFSDSTGLAQVNSLCLPQYSSVELAVSRKFYALSAAAALLKYVEFVKNVIFAPKSLKIVSQSATDIMNIDVDTAQRLELVLSRSGNDTTGSLYGILNHCSTISGSRFLRANILQPPTSVQQIDRRLNCVTELVQNLALLHSLQSTVAKFKDVEQLLWLCVQTPNFKDDQTAAESQINYVLLLKTTMDNIPVLKDCLKNAQTKFFHKVLEDLGDEKFEIILNCINEVINENARVTKGYAASQIQRCYAVKTGINALLDIARHTHSDIINNITENIKKMAEEFDLPLKMSNTGNKGFHIQFNFSQNKQFSVSDLPPLFIQVSRTKNMITCTTEELVFLNQRIKLVLKEVQGISNLIVFQLLQNLRQHISCLYKLCENIAELDILISFAQVSSSDNYIRPTFGNVLKLTASRHPILDFINPSSPIPNDVFASSDKNFHLITGPNMGGKSIYIRQIALLQIMAQIGCYVPAASAEFRITNWLFSRIGFDDSIEYNASSFMLEMEEMQYISRNIGQNSLVIVDELGRSTSTEEGTAIAWAFCEHLLQFTAFIFFTTHLLFLTRLQELYPSLTNSYMKAEEKLEGQDCRLVYTYKLYPGVNQVSNYGLKLARITSLPQSILTLAGSVVDKLVLQQKPAGIVECTDFNSRIYEDVDKWIELRKNKKLTFKEMKEMQLRTMGEYVQPEQQRNCLRSEEEIDTGKQTGSEIQVNFTEQISTENQDNTGEQACDEEQVNHDNCSEASTLVIQLEPRLNYTENSQIMSCSSSVDSDEHVLSQGKQSRPGLVIPLSPEINRLPLYTDIEFRITVEDDYVEE